MPAKKAAKKTSHGLTVFSMHTQEPRGAALAKKLRDESPSYPSIAGTPREIRGAALDPETAAKQYLHQALDSDSVPSFTAPVSDGQKSEFRTLGTETLALTGTKTVKFRQSLNKVPIYGSLVTVELNDDNSLVSINSALGEPKNVSPVAKISPAAALKAIKQYPGFEKHNLENAAPRLNYYFDQKTSAWKLVFIVEDVEVTPKLKAKPYERIPRKMDYIVDAHNGKVIAELPRTPTASVVENAVDGIGRNRQIRVQKNGNKRTLKDDVLNISTFDFRNDDPIENEAALPGRAIKNPPQWSPSSVSAHANAAVVADFLRNVLRRNNIDNMGGAMISSINCVVQEESADGRQWFNAFWNSQQMVYGQRLNGNTVLSLSVNVDIVGHEMFHGVTEHTARLEYAAQSGALNESYSDIFGTIIANFGNQDPRTWDWELGEGLSPDGRPFRDMSDPTRFNQPDHMRNFRVLPITRAGDWGGVHVNSGIHNKAAFLILTAVNGGNLVFNPTEVAAVFYLALTQQLSRTSQFSDSRRGVVTSALTLFRNLPQAQQTAKLNAITNSFNQVGIQ